MSDLYPTVSEPHLVLHERINELEAEHDALRHDLERAVAENARLWACVKAADAMRQRYGEMHSYVPAACDAYDAARAALDGDKNG